MPRRQRTAPPTKPCAGCGRTITWRKAWAADWAQVRWCSAACRRRGITAVDRELEAALVALLAERGGTVEVAEAARRVGGDDPGGLDEPAKRAARRLHHAGTVVLTSRGRPVADPSRVTGPLQVRRP